jgi:2',3'-cyclic-nucleotide 2'-phosphodiesterase/3'-nucleotidase
MALNNYRQTGGGGYSMLSGAPVVYDRQLEIRQLLIDEVRSRGTIRPSDYFHLNWRIVPSSAIGRLLQTP